MNGYLLIYISTFTRMNSMPFAQREDLSTEHAFRSTAWSSSRRNFFSRTSGSLTYAGRARVLLRPFHRPRSAFLWCCRRATQLGVDLSGFPNVTANFKRMQERPSVKKLLAYEKEVNEGFAKTA
jgi:hypothetical protein